MTSNEANVGAPRSVGFALVSSLIAVLFLILLLAIPAHAHALASAKGRRLPTLGLALKPYSSGFGKPHPSYVWGGGDPTSAVSRIKWGAWGRSKAVGRGMSVYVAASQTVAEGTFESATIVAWDLGTYQGRYIYRKVVWYFPQHGETFKTASTSPYHVWRVQPSTQVGDLRRWSPKGNASAKATTTFTVYDTGGPATWAFVASGSRTSFNYYADKTAEQGGSGPFLAIPRKVTRNTFFSIVRANPYHMLFVSVRWVWQRNKYGKRQRYALSVSGSPYEQ
jgi:hypothetical protein